jgi:hypothetical protein
MASIFMVEKSVREENQREQVASSLLSTCSRWFLAREFFYPESN